MNILVGTPNGNYDLTKIEKTLKQHEWLNPEQFFFDDQELTAEQIRSIDVLFGYSHKYLSAILDDPDSQLKFIQALTVGYDYFPVERIKARGIAFASVKGIHSEPIAETVLGMILNQYRHLNLISHSKEFVKPKVPFKLIKGRTAVLFGTGNIGARTAQLLKAFHVNILGVNTRGHQEPDFDQCMAIDNLPENVFNADIVINSLPLTDATRGMFDQAFFDRFTKQPLFVNVGRGQSVITADLIAALKNGKLSAASLDVVDPEPLPQDSPLWAMNNVFISPHIASQFDRYIDESVSIFAQNMTQFEAVGTIAVNKVNLK